jgi:hypothetical protein
VGRHGTVMLRQYAESAVVVIDAAAVVVRPTVVGAALLVARAVVLGAVVKVGQTDAHCMRTSVAMPGSVPPGTHAPAPPNVPLKDPSPSISNNTGSSWQSELQLVAQLDATNEVPAALHVNLRNIELPTACIQ